MISWELIAYTDSNKNINNNHLNEHLLSLLPPPTLLQAQSHYKITFNLSTENCCLFGLLKVPSAREREYFSATNANEINRFKLQIFHQNLFGLTNTVVQAVLNKKSLRNPFYTVNVFLSFLLWENCSIVVLFIIIFVLIQAVRGGH